MTQPDVKETDREIPPRKNVKLALKNLGMSVRQVDAFMRTGWKGLVGATKAENAELKEEFGRLSKLTESLNK